MLGIKFIKVQPTTYLLQFRGGKVVRDGLGLSFFYYAPTTSLVAVPVASADVPFIFQEITGDFQSVTIQGQVTYRTEDPMFGSLCDTQRRGKRNAVVQRGDSVDRYGIHWLAEKPLNRGHSHRAVGRADIKQACSAFAGSTAGFEIEN